MSKVCYLCNKQPMSGNNVSHSNRHTRRTYGVNVHKITIEENGKAKKVYSCTRCMRTMKNA